MYFNFQDVGVHFLLQEVTPSVEECRPYHVHAALFKGFYRYIIKWDLTLESKNEPPFITV